MTNEFRMYAFAICGLLVMWMLSVTELRYWIWGEAATARIVERAEEIKPRDDRPPVTFVVLSITYPDPKAGAEQNERLSYAKPTVEDEKAEHVEIEFIPGVSGTARQRTVFGRYFAVLFLGSQALFVLVVIWGWRMARADTWAWKD